MLPRPADPIEPSGAATAGAPRVEPPFAVPPIPLPTTRPASIIAFVFGALVFVPIVTQVIAIGVGCTAVARRRRPDERVGLAWAGVILGTVALACWIPLVVSFAGGLYSAVSVGRTSFVMPPGGLGAAENEWERTGALAEEMQRVYSAATAYRRDFGRWPDSVDRLAGRWLPVGYSLPEQLEYRPAPPTADPRSGWLLLVSTGVRFGVQGNRLASEHRLALRLDGEIELVLSSEIQALLGGPTASPGAAP